MSVRTRVRGRACASAVALAVLAVSGCGGGSHRASTSTGRPTTTSPTTTSPAPRTIRLTSPAFADGGTIPRRYTCDGAGTALPLRWSGVPAGAHTLTLVMRDPDAPGGGFIHWRVTRIPASATHIGGGASLPPDAIAERNRFGVAAYRGPCPPHGDTPHHYVITLTADSAANAPLASGQLSGAYAR